MDQLFETASEQRTAGRVLRLLAALYAADVYLSIFGTFYLMGSKPEMGRVIFWLLFLSPFLLLFVSGGYIRRHRSDLKRQDLLDAVILEKYLMIPLFLIGGICILFLLVITISPIVIMIFIGPLAISILSTIGWIYMICGLVFSLPYLKKAKEDGILGGGTRAAVLICQFFFSLDVLSFMVICFKEKRWVKLTAAIVIIALLIIVVVIAGIAYGAAHA